MLERHRTVVLLARKIYLLQDAVGENIVFDHVVLAVVLVQATTLAAVRQIVAHHDTGAALVHIETPSAVAIRVDIVDHVALHAGAGRHAESIDGTHVGEYAPSQVVDMVIGYQIVNRGTRCVAPHPAHRYTRVAHVGYLVVGNAVVGRMEEHHTTGAGEEQAAVTDDVVVDDGSARHVIAVGIENVVTHLDTTGSQIVEQAVADHVVAAVVPNPNAIVADVADLTVVDHDTVGIIHLYRGLDIGSSLLRRHSLLGCVVSGVGKTEVAECLVAHPLVWGALDFHDLAQHGCIDLGCLHLLARQGDVKQRTVAVEKPLAGRVERSTVVFEDESGVLSDGIPRLLTLSCGVEATGVGLGVKEEGARVVPLEVISGQHIARFALREAAQRGKVFGTGHHLLRSQRLDAVRTLHLDMFLHIGKFKPLLVRRSCPHGSPAIDIQLLEAPLIPHHLGHMAAPPALGSTLPTREADASADDGLFFAIAHKHHRPVVGGGEDDGILQGIDSLGKMDVSGIACGQIARLDDGFTNVVGLGDGEVMALDRGLGMRCHPCCHHQQDKKLLSYHRVNMNILFRITHSCSRQGLSLYKNRQKFSFPTCFSPKIRFL